MHVVLFKNDETSGLEVIQNVEWSWKRVASESLLALENFKVQFRVKWKFVKTINSSKQCQLVGSYRSGGRNFEDKLRKHRRTSKLICLKTTQASWEVVKNEIRANWWDFEWIQWAKTDIFDSQQESFQAS